MTKMKKHVLKLAHGVTVTVERPYTPEDAVAEFKKNVEALGGKVTQVQNEIAVSGVSGRDVDKLMAKLSENLGEAYAVHTARPVADYSALEERVLAQMFDGGPFGFPSFMHLARPLSEVAQAHMSGRSPVQAPKPKAKKVADVAPRALSTWEFSQEYLQRVYGTKVHVVGQHFRPKRAQNVIGYKKVGNMALLVAEPDNPVDLNAIMVLMWEDETKSWQHVGYVRATEAALLRSKWTGDFKRPMVSRITSYPSNADGHRGGRNIELTLTGEVRQYPGYQL